MDAALLAELERVATAGLPCAWCTLVATRGSTPQKAGATMLVFPDGGQAGTLGGGCVEAEVRRRALAALAEGAGPAVHEFLLDDDHGWDDGLICGGRMTALVTPVGPESAEYVAALGRIVGGGAGHVEVVALPGNASGWPVGARWLSDVKGKLEATLSIALDQPPGEPGASAPGGFQLAAGHSSARDATHKSNPPGADAPGSPAVRDGLAYLPTPPQTRLLIVGGGHVGRAVARLAAEVGFAVTVLDDRESLVSAERFPTAARRITADIGRTLRDLALALTSQDFALIVTRGHNHDEEALFHLAPTAAGYVGMIGSRRKVRLIFDDLRAKGVGEEALARVRAPVGLEIGSQTVPEIAVSIVAELIARRNLPGDQPNRD